MKVHELVARFAAAGESADPIAAAKEELQKLRGDLGALERALAHISGTGGNARQVFYRSPQITLLKVCFPNGRRTPPHDHGTWAALLLLECLGDAPAIGLHVYGGDVLELPRRMWHPETLEEHPLDWVLYDSFARLASAAPGAPAA